MAMPIDSMSRVTGGFDRRTVLLAGASSLAAGRMAAQVPPERGSMLKRAIPSTGEAMPVIGLRTCQVFDVDGSSEELAQRREVLDVLFSAGGRMIDSSPMYGRSEAAVGTLLSAMKARDKAYLATKVWTRGEADGIRQMETSMTRMQAG